MRYYELLYVIHPNIEQEGLSTLIGETKQILKKRGGELLYEEVLGKRRLAYPIQKQRFGTYVLLQFRGDGSGNPRMNQDFELNDNILAHLVVRVDENDIRDSSEDSTAALDQQKDQSGDGEAAHDKEAADTQAAQAQGEVDSAPVEDREDLASGAAEDSLPRKDLKPEVEK